MQMAVSLKRYVLEVENWIEVFTIILTSVILFYNASEDGTADDNEDDLRRHLVPTLWNSVPADKFIRLNNG
jgi:hypothetical protein